MKRKIIHIINFVLAEQNKTSKWLSEQVDMKSNTACDRITITSQPQLAMLIKLRIFVMQTE
jgi:hypothetical protein